MKKLFRMAMIGSMVLGAQSMVFANTASTSEMVKLAVPATEVNEVEIKAATLTEAMPSQMTEEEKAADVEKVKEICEVLNIQYDENTTLGQLFATLTEEQVNKLVDLEIIQVVEATETTAATVMEAIPATSIASQN